MQNVPFYSKLPFQSAFVGARAQRLANLLDQQGSAFFDAAGSQTPIRCTSLILFLSVNGPASLVEIARAMGDDHQLTAHRMIQLESLSLVNRKPDPNDKRRRTFHLTGKGRTEAALLEERCRQSEHIFKRLNAELGFNLAEALDAAFDALSETSVGERSDKEPAL